MRIDVCNVLHDMWRALDRAQIHFLAENVGGFLELTLVQQRDIRQLGLSLYFSLLEREWREERSFTKVETQTIDALDRIANEGLADELFKDSFTHRYSRHSMSSYDVTPLSAASKRNFRRSRTTRVTRVT
jgi:hypothetical protein